MSGEAMRVVIKGPFTEEDLRQIVDVLRMIESTRPTETFEFIIDAPETDIEIELSRVAPLPPSYERHIKGWDRS